MELSGIKNTFSNASKVEKLIFIAIVFTCFLFLFYYFPPASQDWILDFYPASFHIQNPYQIPGFINPPWTAIILYPFHWFSMDISIAINASLILMIFSLLILKKNGNFLSILLTFTSTPFLTLLVQNNIDWIPALGILLENNLSSILLFVKPQAGSLILIDWIVKSKIKISFILLPLSILILSFFIWDNWIVLIMKNIYLEKTNTWDQSNWINLSFFPWSVPFGLIILLFVVKRKPENGEILAVLSTYLISPYFALYSLTIGMALLSVKYKKIAVFCWISLWIILLINRWDKFMLIFS